MKIDSILIYVTFSKAYVVYQIDCFDGGLSVCVHWTEFSLGEHDMIGACIHLLVPDFRLPK